VLLLLASSAGVGLLLSGCGSPAKVASTPAVIGSHGMVHGGQEPVSGVKLQLYTAGTGGYGSASSTTGMGSPFYTGADGSFYFSKAGALSCPSTTSEAYLVGTGGNPGAGTNANLAMMVGLGPCPAFLTAIASPSSTYSVFMNELTTVATVWSLAPFMSGSPSCPAYACIGSPNTTMATSGLANAFASINEVVNSAGQLQTSANYTLPTNEINSLANILQYCINSASSGSTPSTECSNLFTNTTTSAVTPADTITAAMNIAKNPGVNAATLWGLPIPNGRSFGPTLGAAPTDWTIAINYTAGALSTSTPQSLAVDGNGNVWVTSKPSSGAGSVIELTINNAATTAPVYSAVNYTTDINSPYGVAIDTGNNAWITNQGNGYSITEIVPGSTPTFNNFTGNGLNNPEGIAIDGASNVWVVNNGNNTLSAFTSLGATLITPPPSGGGLSSPTSIAVNPIAPN
jgi:hypothetical protein